MNKSNPPMGFVSRDWSEEIKVGGVISNEGIRPPGLVPIPVSEDNGKTLDWSQSRDGDSTTLIPLSLNSAIRCEHSVVVNGPRTGTYREFISLDDNKLSKIRLNVLPETLEAAARAAGDLRKRYDLLFFHLGTTKPARLTAVVSWAVSVSKIPAHAWKAPIPTSMIEAYLSENAAENSSGTSSPVQMTQDWKRAVDEFISKCDEMDQARGRRRSGLPPVDDQLRRCSRASSKASSISEGHVSPDDDRPSRKVVHHDD